MQPPLILGPRCQPPLPGARNYNLPTPLPGAQTRHTVSPQTPNNGGGAKDWAQDGPTRGTREDHLRSTRSSGVDSQSQTQRRLCTGGRLHGASAREGPSPEWGPRRATSNFGYHASRPQGLLTLTLLRAQPSDPPAPNQAKPTNSLTPLPGAPIAGGQYSHPAAID